MSDYDKRASQVSPEAAARRALHSLLQQESTHGSVLLLALCDLWGDAWLAWDPKTVQLELRDDFGVQIEPDLFDKLMAARQVLTSDQVFTELPAFITIARALLGDGVDTPVSEPMDPGDLATAVLEMTLIWPPDSSETFNEEIVGYMEESLKYMGVIGVPNSLVPYLPEPAFSDPVASDPDSMDLIFQRLNDINQEVLSWLKSWAYQLKQLSLVNGSVEPLLERFKDLLEGDKTQMEKGI